MNFPDDCRIDKLGHHKSDTRCYFVGRVQFLICGYLLVYIRLRDMLYNFESITVISVQTIPGGEPDEPLGVLYNV